MYATRTTLRTLLLMGALAGMTLGTVAYAQVGFRNAASSSALPPQFRAAASAASSIAFVGAGAQVVRETAGSIAPAIPTGTQANDFAVLIIAGRPTDTSEPAAPTDWTLRSSSLREVGTNDLKIMTFYRVLAGGDANPSITLPASWVGSSAGMSGQIAVWRGVDTTTPFDAADVTGNLTTDNRWVPPSITTVTSAAQVVSAVATSDDNNLDIRTAQGFTARMQGSNYDTTTGGDHAIGVADKTQATAGAVTMLEWEQNSNEDDRWAGITFALRRGNAPLTIDVPAGTLQNDVMIASVAVQPSSATITPPAGWTPVRQINNGAATTSSLAVYRKLAGASEPASYTWSFSGSTFAVGGIQSFINIDTTTPIDIDSSGQATASATTHATESVTTTVGNAMIVTSHTYASSRTWTPPTGMTEAFDQPSGANSADGQSIEGSYVLQGVAGATGVQTATAAGDADAGNAHILALRPATPGLTINKPTGTVAADVMIASIGVQPSTTTITPPAGWTLVRRIDNSTGNSNSLAIYRKTDGGSEPASYTWALTGFNHAVGGIQSFSGVDTTTPIDAEDGQSTASGTGHATPSVTRTIQGTMLVTSHSFASSRTWTVPTGMNEAFDVASLTVSNASGQSMEGNWFTEYATGATGAKTATAGGDADVGNAHILALRPASPPALPGGFNAYETSTGAGATTGVIKTKIANNATSVDIIALNTAKTAIYTAFADTVRVELLNASNNSGTLDANSCRSSWTVIQTLADVTFATSNNGRKTISFTQANSYPDARLRISYPTSSPSVIGCSTDNFAIRPDKFTNPVFRDANWETAGTTRTLNNTTVPGGTVHKAGRPFTVTATAQDKGGATSTNYSGTATPTLNACSGKNTTACVYYAPGAPGNTNLAIGASFVAGQLNSDVATYDDVGAIEVMLVDSTFAAVDGGDGSTAAERQIASNTVNVGRFVPDHFAVSLNAPSFGTACSAGSFTYVGERFNYAVGAAPVITVTAQNFANATTLNYAGVLWQITNASLTGKAYTAAAGTPDPSGLPGTDPVIAASGSGIGTLTFGSGTGLFFTRTTPVAPFDADVSLAINVIDADAVAYASNPARFAQATAGNGIAFNSGKSMRFGRLALRNANGSQLVPLPVQMEAQYWGYTNAPTNTVFGFITNTADSCTAIANNNVQMSNFAINLSACETAISGGGTLSAGRLTLSLPAPGNANNGSVLLTANLSAANSGTTCTTVGGGTVAAAGANRIYLQGSWTGAPYDDNPTARVTFGIFQGAQEVIFIRENF